VFTCTSDLSALAESINIPQDHLNACIDSGISYHYCPDHAKFINYRLITGCTMMTADSGKAGDHQPWQAEPDPQILMVAETQSQD